VRFDNADHNRHHNRHHVHSDCGAHSDAHGGSIGLPFGITDRSAVGGPISLANRNTHRRPDHHHHRHDYRHDHRDLDGDDDARIVLELSVGNKRPVHLRRNVVLHRV
jgi:hypothetical protein